MTADAPVRPDYDGAWIGGLVPALLGSTDAGWLPASTLDAQAVVLLVIDGLGWAALQEHRDRLPELSRLSGEPITSTVPSTTAAALTSISTGLPPAEHGLVGYRLRVGGRILNVLNWTVVNADPPKPVAVQPHPVFLGKPIPVVTRAEFEDSGFTKAHLRGVTFLGWRTTSALVEHVRRQVGSREGFVYAYYDGVDKIAHAHGLRDSFYMSELAEVDRLVGLLREVLPSECCLVVTSDHGQVHVGPEGLVKLDGVIGAVAHCAGEGRFRTLFARRGAAVDLLAGCQERFGDIAWVWSREQLFDEGWLGPDAGLEVRSRIGDVILAARAPVAFVDPSQPWEQNLIAHHGSVTAAEMLVPLLAGRGEA